MARPVIPAGDTTMKKAVLAAALAMSVAVAALGQGATEKNPVAGAEKATLRPGMEISVPLRDAEAPMVVYLPSNYTAEAKWPVVFWYHGVETGPSTEFVRRHTGGRDFVVVGMSFAGVNTVRSEKEHQAYLSRERANYQLARLWVVQHASVDQSRFYMGGITRGGWLAGMLCDLEARTLAGVAILLAGRVRSSTLVAAELFKNKPIYIGVGDKDPCILPTQEGREFFRHCGAVVTYEEYRGLGPKEPTGVVPLFASWLTMQGPYKAGIPPADKAKLENRFRASLKDIVSGDDPLTKYELLQSLAEDPALSYFRGTALAGSIDTQLAGMRAISPMKEEWAAEQAFSRLMWQSTNVRTLSEMKAVLDGLAIVSTKAAGTRYGKLAGELEKGVAKAYQKSVEATERARRGR